MKRAKPENVRFIYLPTSKELLALSAVLFFLSFAPLVCGQTNVHANLIATANRKPAPQPKLISETGKVVRLSDYRGKVVLLNFWATDCGGCVLEIPAVIGIQALYINKAFTVVGVSMDIPYENLKNANEAWGKVKPFITKKKINYPILMGRKSLFNDFGLTQLPDTLLIDKEGRIAAVYVGVIDKEDVEANITRLLSE